jgi:hypothetical protein
MAEKYPVKAIDDKGRFLEGEFEAWEESPVNPDQVMIRLHLADLETEKSDDDFFSAMVTIRTELDAREIRMMNYGSSLNVYPSPMSRSMGSGEMAYRLRMGEQARNADLVSIFETGPDVKPSTVSDQEQFYRDWLASLKK